MAKNITKNDSPLTFQAIIQTLERYWQDQGCAILSPIDCHVGAGTFHWATVLRSLGKGSWNCAYHQASKRPKDGRYGENPNRLQQHYQFQVVLKPARKESQDLFLRSLVALGLDINNHDIRFVEDDWESPTLGATGLGYEVWLDGMEVTQFTYFQQIAGFDLSPTSTEITYGLERLAMFIQNASNVYDLIYCYDDKKKAITYGDIFLESEIEFCHYNFSHANTDELFRSFDQGLIEARKLIDLKLYYPAYDQILTLSHTFNLLDARGTISTQERQDYILKIRNLAKLCGQGYLKKVSVN